MTTVIVDGSMEVIVDERVGFIGLGIMGRPMASNLQRAGVPLTVWNRSSAASAALAALGSTVVSSPADVFRASDVVLLMLADEAAVDAVLQRGARAFADMVSGR